MCKETAGHGLSLMTIRSFGPHLNPMRFIATFISKENDP